MNMTSGFIIVCESIKPNLFYSYKQGTWDPCVENAKLFQTKQSAILQLSSDFRVRDRSKNKHTVIVVSVSKREIVHSVNLNCNL